MVKRILILEGTPGVGSHTWRGALSQAGYHVTVGGTLTADAELAACDVLIADATLARGEAAELRAQLQAAEPRPKVLFVVRDFTAETVLQLSSVGDLSLPYPLDSVTLLNALRQLSAVDDHVQNFARTYRLSPVRLRSCASRCSAATTTRRPRSSVAVALRWGPIGTACFARPA